MHTGHLVREIRAPRTENICSVVWFAGRQFINAQGDTLTYRSFPEKGVASVRRLLDNRPGWDVGSVIFRGPYLVVRWFSKTTTPGYPESPVVAVVYDPTNGKVIQEKVETDGSPRMSVIDPLDYDSLRPQLAKGAYRWELSFMGSVRARTFDDKSQQPITVLWDGLRIGATPRPSIDGFKLFPVIDLGNGKGALRHLDGVDLYDATTKQKLATISIKGVMDVKWCEQERMLIAETSNVESGNSHGHRIMHAYRIDSLEATPHAQ